MTLRSDYIDLDRLLISWNETSNSEQAALFSYFSKHSDGSHWKDILEHDRIVVLGEAGSGKTWELQARAELLVQEGKPAFFVRVEHIRQSGLQEALSPGDVERFQLWLGEGSLKGHFFLDATDECRLTSHHALEAALRNFATILGTSLPRARIILSCRVSEWQPKSDPDLILEALPLPRDVLRKYEAKKEKPLQIVQIAPLDRDQIRLIANAHIVDTDAFINAIAEQDLWAFVGRPADALNLIRYWRENLRIGALHEVVEFDIKHKLSESNQNREALALPLDRARVGAMAMAAASQICQVFSFPSSDAHETEPAISVPSLLADWAPQEIKTLMGCAIFDEAAYGKIRFHHRSVAEYLAAQWLDIRIQKGYPRRAINDLLFRESHGKLVLVPSLAPIAAWLSGWHPFVRRGVIAISPETLIHYGDPTLLPPDDKKELIRQLATRSRANLGVGAFAQIKRLAIPDLAPLINSLLVQQDVSRDIKQTLLLIAGEGQLSDCAETALSIAIASETDRTLSQYAIHALAGMGSIDQLKQLCTAYLVRENIDPSLTAELCRACYPSMLSNAELVTLIIKTRFPPQNHTSTFSANLDQIIDTKLSADETVSLLLVLINLTQREPVHTPRVFGQVEDISQNYKWLFDSITKCIEKIIGSLSLTDEVLNLLTRAIRILGSISATDHYYHNHRKQTIQALVASTSTLPKRLFWRAVASQREARESEDHIHMPAYYDLWKLSPSDVDWLLDDATKQVAENDRLLAYRYAIQIWLETGRPRSLRKRLYRIAHNSPEHKAKYNLLVDNWTRRLFWRAKYSFLNRYWLVGWKARLINWFATQHQKWETVIYALTHTKMLREGENWVLLLNLLVISGNAGGGQTTFSKYNHQKLVKAFGHWIATMTRQGFKAYWKTWAPPLREHDFNKSYRSTPVAMIGLATDTEDGFIWTNISPDLAKIAALHSLYELNGVPKWLDNLIEAHPSVVRAVYRDQLQFEFDLPADQQLSIGLLHDLAYGDSQLQKLCEPDVQNMLNAQEPAHIEILKYALQHLAACNSREFLTYLAPGRARSAFENGDQKRLLIWLAIWLQVDCLSALSFIEPYLEQRPDEATDIMLGLSRELFSHFRPNTQVTDPDFTRLENLPRFLNILYRYINPADDQWHEGVFTPDDRDNAQNFRWNVLQGLIEAPPEQDAYSAIMAFANMLPEGEERSSMLQRAADRATVEADKRWTQSQFVAFAKLYEQPTTSDELYTVALARLDDIKDDAENGDFSPRGDFRPDDHEKKIQRWMAKRFDEVRLDSYEVVREAEVADDKEIDIRLIRQSLNPTTIEVKWANKWSYNQHQNAIESQLMGQYMQNNRSQHGIYLMVNLVENRRWEPDGGSSLNFLELCERLQKEADQLVSARGGQEKVTVVGIDLAPRQ